MIGAERRSRVSSIEREKIGKAEPVITSSKRTFDNELVRKQDDLRKEAIFKQAMISKLAQQLKLNQSV